MMRQIDPIRIRDHQDSNDRERHDNDANNHKIVRLFKSIEISRHGTGAIDPAIVSHRFYNAFNYSLLSKVDGDITMAVGITSANQGEGKTLVASNLAVSLALGYQRDVVIVDLNLFHPRLHEIFGTELSPGLVESLDSGSINVSKTSVDHLHILPAGDLTHHPLWSTRMSEMGNSQRRRNRMDRGPAIGLDMMGSFRDILFSLRQQFDFVIVDMPSVRSSGFPMFIASQLQGLLVVIQEGKTKRVEVEKIFQQLDETHVLGFVMNHVKDDVYS